MKTKTIAALTAVAVLTAFFLGAAGTIQVIGERPRTAGPDRLIGAFITEEYLDLFDAEAFFADNAARIAGGGAISEEESGKYRGRLYASGEGSELFFEGVEGVRFFAPKITDSEGSCWVTCCDDAVEVEDLHLYSTDEGERVSLKGTVWITSGSSKRHFYVNPVYQAVDGRVFTTGGNGFLSDSEVSFSTQLTENQSESGVSGTVSSGTEVEVAVKPMDAPTEIAVLQFDADSQLLERRVFAPGGLPEELRPLPKTEYIIVESAVSRGTTGREMFQKEADSFSAFFGRDDGYCVKQSCRIDWDE